MRLIIGILLLGLAACAGQPKVVSQTTGSIEIECAGAIGGCGSPQQVADMAQKHCAQYGLLAQQASLKESQSGNRWVTYNCAAR